MDTSKDIFEKLNSDMVAGYLGSKYFAKGTLLQNAGDASKIFYVKKGILRSYIVDEKGKEYNFMFAPEEWIISDLNSIANNQTSELCIDVLEDCEVTIMTKYHFLEIIQTNHSNNLILSTLLLKRIAVLQKRVLMLMSETALERYCHFIETYPDIMQRIPQKMIASYLGITPQVLSKIRHDLSKSK